MQCNAMQRLVFILCACINYIHTYIHTYIHAYISFLLLTVRAFLQSLDDLISKTVPSKIRMKEPLKLEPAMCKYCHLHPTPSMHVNEPFPVTWKYARNVNHIRDVAFGVRWGACSGEFSIEMYGKIC